MPLHIRPFQSRSLQASRSGCAVVLALLAATSCGEGAPAAVTVDMSTLRGEPLAPRAEAEIVSASELLAAPAAAAGADEPKLAPQVPVADGLGGDAPSAAIQPPPIEPPTDSNAAKVEAAAKTGGEAKVAKDYKPVAFSDLSGWTYSQPTAKELEADPESVAKSAKERIPAEIFALDGKKIALEGFMSPIDFDKTGVKSFSLIHNAIGCCFGMFPKMNEWVFVEMASDKKCDFFAVEPATIYGTLSVGEEIKDGYVVSLFRLRADHVFGTF
jgi:hypothetical protein